MPRTDFYRPNPLDSDVIMDATARLLAPRHPARTAPSRSEPEHSTGKSRKKRTGSKPVPKQEEVRSSPSAPRQPDKKAAQLPAQKKEGRKNRRSSRRGGRSEEPRRSHAKDSTEQHSLMKPYYLDLDR